MSDKKTIRLKDGSETVATVSDFIDGSGVQSSTATDDRGNRYVIVDRDYYGPIWAKAE